jgi:hypothetical protein
MFRDALAGLSVLFDKAAISLRRKVNYEGIEMPKHHIIIDFHPDVKSGKYVFTGKHALVMKHIVNGKLQNMEKFSYDKIQLYDKRGIPVIQLAGPNEFPDSMREPTIHNISAQSF